MFLYHFFYLGMTTIFIILKFGNSIHCCDLRINKININKFLFKINKNIYGVGMAFINQQKPGPISNDIILDIIKKLKKFIKTK